VQECGIGLVRLRATGDTIAFAAPPLIREGPADPVDAARAIAVLGVDPRQVVDVQWADNGPGWLAVLLDSAETVLALRPDFVAMGSLKVGAVGPHPAGGGSQWEVRAFVPGIGVPEDPVTGSLNAGLARWFFRDGIADGPYVASQGAALGRRGRITVRPEDGELWVGGASTTVVRGSVEL
jgi:PhzF family phenazine biosynthesis protein